MVTNLAGDFGSWGPWGPRGRVPKFGGSLMAICDQFSNPRNSVIFRSNEVRLGSNDVPRLNFWNMVKKSGKSHMGLLRPPEGVLASAANYYRCADNFLNSEIIFLNFGTLPNFWQNFGGLNPNTKKRRQISCFLTWNLDKIANSGKTHQARATEQNYFFRPRKKSKFFVLQHKLSRRTQSQDTVPNIDNFCP